MNGAFIVATIVAVTTQGLQAQDRRAELIAWLEGEMQAFHQIPTIGEAKLTMTIEWHVDASPERLAMLQRTVQNKPDHPLFSDLSAIQTYIHSGPTYQRVTFWSKPAVGWRYALAYAGSDGLYKEYRDYGSDNLSSWLLTPNRLILDRPEGATNVSRSPLANFDSARIYINLLLIGPLGALAQDSELDPNSVQLNGDRWAAEFGSSLGRSTASGRWDEEAGRWFTMSLLQPRPETSMWKVPAESKVSNWIFSPELDRWVASTSQKDFASATVRPLMVFESAERVSRDDVAKAVATPEPDRVDPLRGKLTFRAIEDLRAVQNPAAEPPPVNSEPHAGAATPSARDVGTSDWPLWRIAAACGAVVTLCGLIAHRMNASFRSG